MSNENIIREIDEELRSDRMRNIWQRFGGWLIGAAVLIVLLVAANEGWQWWQKSSSASSSDQFYAALELADGSDIVAAQEALNGVIAANHGGYPALARFRSASLLAKDGKTAEAIAAYDAIATGETNRYLRELAFVLSGTLLVDEGDIAQVEQRVGGLTTAESPMRNAAREAIGLAKYKAGDLDGARIEFEAILADPLASAEARNRLQIYLMQLVAEGAAPAVALDAATDAEASAEPSVGDAPELDTTEAPADDVAPAN